MNTEMYYMDASDLEARADQVKAIVLSALAGDGTLSIDIAEEWAKSHTVVYRKKSFFRTVSNLWHKTDEADGNFITIVRDVPCAVCNVESEANDAKPS